MLGNNDQWGRVIAVLRRLRERYAFRNLTRNQRIVVLALAAALILAVGVLLKPAERGPAPPSPSDLARIQMQSQRRGLEGIADYFQMIAGDLEGHLVKVDGPEAPGVVWDANGTILAADRSWRNWQPRTVQADGAQVEADSILPSPEFSLGVVHVKRGAGLAPVVRRNTDLLQSGEWLEFVSWSGAESPSFVYGAFLRVRRALCEDVSYREVVTSIPLDVSMEGGGLFDMDGNFLALIASCGDRRTAIATESLPAIIERAGSFEGRLAWRHGLKIRPLEPGLKSAFQADTGVLVSGVRKGYPAEGAGFEPGDVIFEMDGAPIRKPNDLLLLNMPPARLMFEIKVHRGGRTASLLLPAEMSVKVEGNKDAAVYGATVVAPPAGLELEGARPGSLAYDIGLRDGDRIIRVEQMASNSVSATRRFMAGLSRLPRYLVVERGDWRLLLLPPPGMEARLQ